MSSSHEYWKSSAIRELLKRCRAEDPEALMRHEAQKLLSATEQDSPPFSTQRVASLRKIKKIVWAEISSMSELVPINGGFILRIKSQILAQHNSGKGERWTRPSAGLQNFSIAHEIGHTFFYNIDMPVPSRPARDTGSIAEERLCDIFATELLMPRERFTEDAKELLQKQGHLTKKLIKLSNSYKVSIQATVIRLLELGILDKVVIIKWDWMLNPNKTEDSIPKLRIDWAEPATYPYIPRNASAPKGSIFERASFAVDVLYEQSIPIKIGGLNKICPVEAFAYGELRNLSDIKDSKDGSPVLSIIWLSDK